ncbi:MAG: ABC transporter ATP-binding protein, partial [Clostridia bacterium]
TDLATPDKESTQQRSVEVERESAQSKMRPCIEFRDMSFAYENKKIFEHFNCQIQYGESVAFVGGSGSGKSTLSKLAMRLYDVTAGQVLVHGKDVRDYSAHDLRVSFGVVPQNPFLFFGSIWDNVKIARPNATNKEIIHAMEVAHVHEFVNELENGWNTVVGNGGLDLSGGQKQRIAIARAVLGKPDILIFDEATSALDNISERAIQAAMESLMKDHTVIMIAHRLSTIRNVDRVIVLEKGKIVEEGSYQELCTKEGGAFAALL